MLGKDWRVREQVGHKRYANVRSMAEDPIMRSPWLGRIVGQNARSTRWPGRYASEQKSGTEVS